MKQNSVKARLQNGEATFGTWLSLGELYAARVLARMGWDWLTLDLEHGAIDWSQAAVLFAAIADAGCVPLARVPEGNHHYIKRVLDAGAMGIVVPMVESADQARVAIAAAKYPPEGNRSAGGGMHSMNFGTTSDEYYQQANDQILVVLQAESPLGVNNAASIYGQPGCDAVFIGPVDLRFQMRAADGSFPTADEHEAVVQQVIQVGRSMGTPTGIHVRDPAAARERVQQGMQFIAVSSDLGMITESSTRWLDALHPERSANVGVNY